MAIEFRCPTCQKLLRTPDESAGRKARCPECSTIVDVPLTDPSVTPAGPSLEKPQEAPAGAATANPFAETSPGAAAAAGSPFAESANPYASSYAGETTWTATPGVLQRRIIGFGELWDNTWRVLTEHISSFLVAGLIFVAITFVLNIVFSGIQQGVAVAVGMGNNRGGPDPAAIGALVGINILTSIIGFVVQTWLQAGMLLFVFNLIRTQTADFGLVFKGGPFLLRLLGVGILVAVISAVIGGVPMTIGVVAAIALEDNPVGIGIAIGAIGIAVILLIVVALSVYLSHCFIIDQNDSVIGSLSRSYEFMKGNRMTVFAVGLVAGALGLAFTLVTCCIGYLVVVPALFLIQVMAYLLVTGQAGGGGFKTQPRFQV